MAKHNMIVKYNNPINSLNVSQLNQLELNVFVSLISTVKDRGTQNIQLGFNDFRQLARVEKNIPDSTFNELVVNTFKKIGAGSITLQTKDKFMLFPLFQRIVVDSATKKIKYNVSDEFVKYFNNFAREYTTFPLFDFTAIKGKYAKIMYKQLMQFATTGTYHVNYDTFIYKILGVPESAIKTNINSKYIKSNIEKLKKYGYFKNLSVTYLRSDNKFTAIEFKWEPFTSKDFIKRSKNNQANFDEKEYDNLLNEIMEDSKKNKRDVIDVESK